LLWYLAAAAFAGTPDEASVHWESGWTAYSARDWAGAVSAWEEVRKLDPKHPELDFWLAVALTRSRWATQAVPTVAEPETAAAKGATVTFAAAGDTMMGSDLKKGPAGLSPEDGAVLFAETGPLFRAADIAFLNLEGPLADDLPNKKCKEGSTDCHSFRTPTRYAKALTGAGIDVASLANNHAMDLGSFGMVSSMGTLDAVGIAHAGPYGDVAYVERDGVVVAFVGAHSGECCLNVNDLDDVKKAVAEADAKADLVVLSFHGGAEGAKARHVPGQVEIAWGEPRGDVRALAHTAIDAGADLVLGHGPHVLRAMEVYKGRLVAYSLGNFTGYRQFGTGGGPGGTTVVLEAELAPNGVLVAAKLHAVALDAESIPKLDPTGAAYAMVNELSSADFPKSGVKVAADGTVSW
jgi:hypothetical protein